MGMQERKIQDYTVKYAKHKFNTHGINFMYETRTATQYGGAGLADTDWTIGLGWCVDVEFKTARNKLSRLQAHKQSQQNTNHVLRTYFSVSSKQGGKELVDLLFKIYVEVIEPRLDDINLLHYQLDKVDFK